MTSRMLIVLMFALLILVGCNNETEVESVDVDRLEKEQVKKVIELRGIGLEEIDLSSPLEEDVSVTPYSFQISETEDNLFIYVFDSVEERKEDISDSLGHGVEVNGRKYHPFTAKNVALIYEADDDTDGDQYILMTTKLDTIRRFMMDIG
ncbi:hypothetical protein [Natranaerobius trueperi]|uniref:Uncharacterized protein n=1 Tax=Natranaerobius trueperi TaxID=759412 RepID=A0A226BX83_9FIRM|nr:hypothetical protein [Natranaerobius trueperi]OWZ82717.1 hypothetical protein CDO51_12560 [Natranaerobius trueperi]